MERVDFLVIGAGIAGLSAAAELAQHGTLVVCEAESAPGFHASGRSAAFAHFDMDSAVVRALTAASMPLFSAPEAQKHPALFIALDGQAAMLDRLDAHYRQWQPEAKRLTVAEATALVPILDRSENGMSGALLDGRGLKLDAHAMLEGHRRVVKHAGARLETNSEVIGLEHRGGRWIVDTAGASYSARVLINAAGAWVDQIASKAGVKPIGIQPLRRTVITFDVPKGLEVAHWPFSKTVGTGFYIEAEGNGRLLACPMDEHSSEPCDAQPEEEDVALAAWRVEQSTTLEVRCIVSKWAGLRSFAPDREPVCGFDGAAPGFFWLAGQGGFGLQTSPAMALAAASLACGLDWPERLAEVGLNPEQLSPARLR